MIILDFLDWAAVGYRSGRAVLQIDVLPRSTDMCIFDQI